MCRHTKFKKFCRKAVKLFTAKNISAIINCNEALKKHKQLAEYMKRAENGGLTPEEQENRGALLKFLQGPCDLPDELF